MYIPAQFNHPQHAVRIMREHPFASLVVTDEAGFPHLTHLPLVLEADGDTPLRLLGHCARANPLVGHLQREGRALVSFLGPHAYMTPSVYPDVQRVPTWNYVAVQAKVSVRLLEGETAKDALLKLLIAQHEPAYAVQWRSLPERYTHGMLQGMVAFELTIEHVDCAVKLNQHRPESHAAMHDQYRQGDADAQGLAQWMRDLKLV